MTGATGVRKAVLVAVLGVASGLASYAAVHNVADIVFLHNEEYLAVLRESIRSARQSVYVEMYLIRPSPASDQPVGAIFAELASARKRGVQVTVLLDSHFDKENQMAAQMLKTAGVWDVTMDDEKVTNHTKLVIIDDEVIILGSQNWTLSALASSNESAVIVRDRRVATELIRKLKREGKDPRP